MSEELKFFSYLIEYYAEYKKTNGAEVLRMIEEKNLTEKVMKAYFIYHQEALENAFKDIDSLMETGKHMYYQ